jgi:hypothetical protein
MKWIVITASSERAPVVQEGWADGQRIVVVIVSQIPVATASTYNDNALYTSKWTTTEQWSEDLGLVHPNVVKPVCRIYCVAQRGRPSPIIFTSAAATTSVLAKQF